MPGPKPRDSNIEILRAVATFKTPFVIAKDIEPQLSIKLEQVRNRLDLLVAEGYLNHRKAGNTDVYWLTEEGRSRLHSSEM